MSKMTLAWSFDYEQNARDAAVAVIDTGGEAVVVVTPESFDVLVSAEPKALGHARGVVFGVAFARKDSI